MNLEKAIEIALRSHQNQKDKAGQPYILHPLRIMFCFDSGQERVVAVLHDVLEDSGVTALDLEMAGFDRDVIEAVQCLTRRSGEDYMDFVDRVAKNPLARRVKVQDILDNLNLSRLWENLTDDDLERIAKYHKALLILRNII